MSDALALTAAAAAARIRAGDLDPAELWDGYRARAAADDHNAFTWVADDAPPAAGDGPLAGVPVAVKDLFATKGVPSQAGSRILEGYRPPYTATAVERLTRGRRAAAGQDEPGRVRDGLVDRELRLRADHEPVGPDARARGQLRRLRRGRRRRQRAVGDRDRHRRLDPPARRAVRDRRAQADLRRRQPLRDDRLRLVARPGRPVHARRDRRRAAARRDGREGPVRLDLGRAARARSSCRAGPTCRASGSACRRS